MSGNEGSAKRSTVGLNKQTSLMGREPRRLDVRYSNSSCETAPTTTRSTLALWRMQSDMGNATNRPVRVSEKGVTLGRVSTTEKVGLDEPRARRAIVEVQSKFRFGDRRPTSFSAPARLPSATFKLLIFCWDLDVNLLCLSVAHIFHQAHAIVGFGSDSRAPFRWFPLKHDPRVLPKSLLVQIVTITSDGLTTETLLAKRKKCAAPGVGATSCTSAVLSKTWWMAAGKRETETDNEAAQWIEEKSVSVEGFREGHKMKFISVVTRESGNQPRR
ncbi:hypothetical protein B0H14DRAFT_2592515 [Mycena olivaceomarginata]|nr:hypothetical protein B0H14DRAFT_2592515 [Mycena olivaceomarginata]